MSLHTLPRSSGRSAAARRMLQAGEARAAAKLAGPAPVVPPGGRAVTALKLTSLKPAAISAAMPAVRVVAPTQLIIETAYQRALSKKSQDMIRRIVNRWDWIKFKPPICAEHGGALFVIDGQHTAIAAATHPGISKILVLVVGAAAVETRAEAFVSHNRDRLKMSALQVFHAEAVAGDAAARAMLKIVASEGGSIPKYVPQPAYAKPGQLTAIGEMRRAYEVDGPEKFGRLVRILVKSGVAPIPRSLGRALRMILTRPDLAALASRSDAEIAAAIRALNTAKQPLDMRARQRAHETGLKRDRACALLIAEAAGVSVQAEAA